VSDGDIYSVDVVNVCCWLCVKALPRAAKCHHQICLACFQRPAPKTQSSYTIGARLAATECAGSLTQLVRDESGQGGFAVRAMYPEHVGLFRWDCPVPMMGSWRCRASGKANTHPLKKRSQTEGWSSPPFCGLTIPVPLDVRWAAEAAGRRDPILQPRRSGKGEGACCAPGLTRYVPTTCRYPVELRATEYAWVV
jgi:hypothetical protein